MHAYVLVVQLNAPYANVCLCPSLTLISHAIKRSIVRTSANLWLRETVTITFNFCVHYNSFMTVDFYVLQYDALMH